MTISGVHQNIMCYILKMSSIPIILGTEYLTENKVILDFSNKTVSMSSETFNLSKCTVVYKNEDPEFKVHEIIRKLMSLEQR
jgi:hypothetical protein